TDLKHVSLADEVRRMLDFLEIPLDEAQLRVQLHGDARAAVDPSLFRRAMTNLLINAIQHSAPGATLTVTIARRDTLVDVSVANPG
ncbi:two-component sensor histidine kinase, partial [Paraburkholderia sp. SIMBA_050]